MKKLYSPMKAFSVITLTGLLSSGLFSISTQAAELITFSNGNVADANDVNHNFQELANRIVNSASTAGPKGDKGDKGDPGNSANSSAASLSLLNSFISSSTSSLSYPYAILDAQNCQRTNTISATAVIADKININISQLLGHEGISELFEFSFIGQSATDINAATLIGNNTSISIRTAQANRTINGIITKAARTYAEDGTVMYAVSIEPAMAKLKATNDYRIYQQMSRGDIILELMQNEGITTDLSLQNAGEINDMLVMYNQSPFNYLQRLTEEAGFAYFFDGNTTIFTDNTNAYLNSAASLSFIGQNVDISLLNTETQSYAFSFFNARQASATLFSTAGYNFQSPDTTILNSQGTGQPEKYTFSFLLNDQNKAASASVTSAAREHARNVHYFGSSNNPLLQAGYRFSLTTGDAGKAGSLAGNYVTTKIKHALTLNPLDNCLVYANSFSSLPDTIIYKPALKAPKAIAPGVTTAVVVGPAGETKYTDAYGRVKVKFHWDRQGTNNENSSAWVRVAMPVDRINDPLLYVPLIGTEVLINFLNGDPSLPVVTGSLYNNNHMPPLPLPTNRFANGGNITTDLPK